jgi:hypothetical protein
MLPRDKFAEGRKQPNVTELVAIRHKIMPFQRASAPFRDKRHGQKLT